MNLTNPKNFPNLELLSDKARRVLTAAIAAAVLVAATAAIGKMMSGV